MPNFPLPICIVTSSSLQAGRNRTVVGCGDEIHPDSVGGLKTNRIVRGHIGRTNALFLFGRSNASVADTSKKIPASDSFNTHA